MIPTQAEILYGVESVPKTIYGGGIRLASTTLDLFPKGLPPSLLKEEKNLLRNSS